MGRAKVCTCVVLVMALLYCGASGEKMALNRRADNVAGIVGQVGSTDGPKGESKLNNPIAICESYDNDQNILLIGELSNFRTYNVTSQRTGTWNIPYRHQTNMGICACVTVRSTSAPLTSVFYINCANEASGRNILWRITNGVIYDHDFPKTTDALVAIAHQTLDGNEWLYLLDQGRHLIQCPISPTTMEIFGCSDPLTLNVPASLDKYGLAVQNDDVFVTNGANLLRFNLSDGAALPGLATALPFTDVGFTTRTTLPPQLMAITTNNFFTIDVAADGLVANPILDVSDPYRCVPVLQDEQDPVFCGLTRFLAITPDTIYGTLSTVAVFRQLYLPDVVTQLTVAPSPLPIGMTNASTVLSTVFDLIDHDLATLLQPATGADVPRVNRTSAAVDAYPWPTTMQLFIPQRLYDNDTTEAAIEALNVDDAADTVGRYYARTNLSLYGDTNVFPICNVTKMRLLGPQSAYFARDRLQYPLIYSDPLEVVTLNGNPNITRVKLLLPWSFDDGVNQTSRTLLNQTMYMSAMLSAIAATYDGNHQNLLVFHGDTYNFDTLTAAQVDQLRWMVQNMVEAQIVRCRSMNGGDSGGAESSDDSLSCTPRVGITNMTRVPLVSKLYPDYEYTVFIPESYNYSFDLTTCLSLIDWSFILDWMSTDVVQTSHKKCGTGCIVGIAVAAAVVAAVLIILLIILVSKRRRLATVVVPPPLKEPEFASTVDMEASNSSNPLQV